jgi:hypothetical protein
LSREFNQIFKQQLTTILFQPFRNKKKEETFLNKFYEASIILILKPDKDSIGKKTCSMHRKEGGREGSN